jgi:hypothetical protein
MLPPNELSRGLGQLLGVKAGSGEPAGLRSGELLLVCSCRPLSNGETGYDGGPYGDKGFKC